MKKMNSLLLAQFSTSLFLLTIASINAEDTQPFSTEFNKGYNITRNLVEEIINQHEDSVKSSLGISYFTRSKENFQTYFNDISDKINNQIKSDLNEAAKAIQEHYHKKMELFQIQKLPTELKRGHYVLLNMVEKLRNVSTTKELLVEIHDNVRILDIIIPRDNILNVVNQGEYLEILKITNNEKLNSGSLLWLQPFEDVVKDLYESENWYLFLNDLYAKFSSYEILRERYLYNVADIEDWGKARKPQGITITNNNFKPFLNKIAEYNISEYDTLKNITLTELQLTELNHVLNLTLKYKLKISCAEPEAIVVMADYLMFTTFTENDLQWDDKCNLTIILKNLKNIKHVCVFILNTLFVDKDQNLNTLKVPYTVMAPKWEIIGTKNFDLHGWDGDFDKWGQTEKAKDGAYPGNNGENGTPGKPGLSGGTFFGIGETFINGANLTITSNGGMGGPGQNGGNGQIGTDGRAAIVPSPAQTSCDSDLCDDNKKLNGFSCENIHCNSKVITVPIRTITDCRYKIFGMPGGKGGDGGHGGRGGKGGYPGNVVIFELNNSSGISINNITGKPGLNGKGGIGAVGGNNGNDVVAQCWRPDWSVFRFKTSWNLKEKINNRNSKKQLSGRNGLDGANESGMQDPITAVSIPESAKMINVYKSYLRENLSDRFKKHAILQFLRQMDSNNNVKRVYDTLGLVNDLQSLEEQLHKLEKDDFISFCDSLLNRISEYAESPKQTENTNQYKKVLNYLYTATLGRIYNLNENSDPSLIIDISGYLNLVNKNIEALKDLQNLNNKADIIGKYKQNYKSSVDNKIEEATQFIEKKVTPEIHNIITQIDNDIDLLINETITMQEQTEIEKQELIKKREKLENMFEIRGLFDCLKIASLITSFLGPMGAAVGSVLGTVSTVTESLVLDKKISDQELLKLPQSVISNLQLLNQINVVKKQKISDLTKLIDEISGEINKYPILNDTLIKVINIRKRLIKVSEKKFYFKEFKELEKDLKQELERKGLELKSKGNIPDEKTEQAKKVVGKFNQAVKLVSIGFDIYNKYRNDNAKIDVITDAIDQAENKFQFLKQYEENIYDIIGPMLKNMGNDVDDIISKLNTKSQISLDITKWQVQSTLKDLKLQIQQLTKGFEVESKFTRCIEKLEEAMTVLINIYGRIQSYQEQQNFANYIADISSAAASNINIVNSNLSSAINHLEMGIRSNLVLKQYKTALDAFKQWVFPFAHLYLAEFILPSHLELESNLENLVSKAVTEIETIKSKVDEYKTSVKRIDKYIYSEEFSSNYVSTKPFFVWKNKQYKNTISKLLSGQEVIIKADVMDSSPNKNAIKFSFIEFIFKSENETMQSEMNDKMKGFDISATHLGNSYYRYDNKIFVITSDSQTIQYSFEKNNVGEPVRKNIVYDKIKAGDLMLSPYTLWEIKLINSTNKIPFQELQIFKDEINIELSGYGSYVNEGVNTSSLMVEDEYQVMNAYNQVDINAEMKMLNTYQLTFYEHYMMY